MQKYILRRLLLLIPTLWGVTVIVFAVLRVTPGDPARLILGSSATPAQVTELRQELGLEDPIYIGYVNWLWDVVRGDLGNSILQNTPVLAEVTSKFANTLILAAVALFIASVVGISAGVFAGSRPNSWLDRLVMVLSVSGVSIPTFWLGIMLIFVFSMKLNLLPPSGMYSPTGGGDPGDVLRHLVLPAVTLAAFDVAVIARMTRAAMVELIRLDFVRVARAKGLPERTVIYRHVLKNAMIPVVTILGIQFGVLLGGAILVESIFAWPGVAFLLLNSILERDYPLIQGAVLLIAIVYILINLVVDISYNYLDPRVRYG